MRVGVLKHTRNLFLKIEKTLIEDAFFRLALSLIRWKKSEDLLRFGLLRDSCKKLRETAVCVLK